MSKEQIQRVIDIAEERLAKGCTKEEAIAALQEMGIVDENGEIYPHRYGLIWAMQMYPNRYQ
jgi:superfamily II helicase